MRIGTSQSMRIPSRTSLVKSVIDEDSGSKDEVERRRLSVGGVLHSHHQVAIEDGIPSVPRFARKVQLGREHRTVRGLHPDVKVACPPGVFPRHDRLEAIATLVVRELVTAQSVAGV